MRGHLSLAQYYLNVILCYRYELFAAQAEPALEQEVPETLGLPTQVVAPVVQLSNPKTAAMRFHSTFRGLRRVNIPKLAVALVAALAVFVGTWFVLHRRSAAGTIAYVQVDAQPWATVRTVAANDGKIITVNQATPLRMALPRGEYTMVLTGPGGAETTEHLRVTPGQVNSYKHDFEVVDVKKIVESY